MSCSTAASLRCANRIFIGQDCAAAEPTDSPIELRNRTPLHRGKQRIAASPSRDPVRTSLEPSRIRSSRHTGSSSGVQAMSSSTIPLAALALTFVAAATQLVEVRT
jgi:hypothetical protein